MDVRTPDQRRLLRVGVELAVLESGDRVDDVDALGGLEPPVGLDGEPDELAGELRDEIGVAALDDDVPGSAAIRSGDDRGVERREMTVGVEGELGDEVVTERDGIDDAVPLDDAVQVAVGEPGVRVAESLALDRPHGAESPAVRGAEERPSVVRASAR